MCTGPELPKKESLPKHFVFETNPKKKKLSAGVENSRYSGRNSTIIDEDTSILGIFYGIGS